MTQYAPSIREKIVFIIEKLLKKTFLLRWSKQIGVSCDIGEYTVTVLPPMFNSYCQLLILRNGEKLIVADEMPKMLEVIYTRAMYQINKPKQEALRKLSLRLDEINRQK